MVQPNLSAYETAINRIVSYVAHLRLSKNPSIYRLKRGSEFLDALLEPGFYELQRELKDNKVFVSDDLLACALLLVARLNESTTRTSFGARLKAVNISQTRLTSLLRSPDAQALYMNLRHVLSICKNEVNPHDLVRHIIGWTDNNRDQVRRRLLTQYTS